MTASGLTWRQFFYFSIVVAGISAVYNLWVFYPTQVEWEAEKQEALAERLAGHGAAVSDAIKGDIENSPVTERAVAKRIGMHPSILYFTLPIYHN